MFSGSRFFNLAKKWKEFHVVPRDLLILKDVMNHYYDSLIGFADSSELIIHRGGCMSESSIKNVLESVGYKKYSIKYRNGDAIITLTNSLNGAEKKC